MRRFGKRVGLFLAVLLLLSCSACGNGSQPSGSSEAGTGKIPLNGTPVKWDQFPMPAAEAFGLTGEDAAIYNAIARVYNPEDIFRNLPSIALRGDGPQSPGL